MSNVDNQSVSDLRDLQGFEFGHVETSTPTVTEALATTAAAAAGVPPLGPLEKFIGSWTGLGFNTIFRPSQPAVSGSDNILQLNVTTESLVFSSGLGSIPNRGEVQPDIFLNGISYLQTVNDVTTPGEVVGLWISVPPTTDPAITSPSLVRMGSIPHGTTILAQGTSATITGAPTIPTVDITPTTSGGVKIKFPSQTASDSNTFRIPKVLPVPGSSLDLADWQAMLADPNAVLRNAISGQTITSTTIIEIASPPSAPFVGGGVQDIAFLLGNTSPNANANKFRATFWIETVSFTLPIPVMAAGSFVTVTPTTTVPGLPIPQFAVQTVSEVTAPTSVTVTYNQIQYTQFVNLNFATLDWPHVSVATLVPATPIDVQLP